MKERNKAIHKMASQKHFNAQAAARIPIADPMNRHTAHLLMEEIRKGAFGSGWVTTSDKHRSWFFVEHERTRFWVLYDKKLRRLVTCLDAYNIPHEVMNIERAAFYRTLEEKNAVNIR